MGWPVSRGVGARPGPVLSRGQPSPPSRPLSPVDRARLAGSRGPPVRCGIRARPHGDPRTSLRRAAHDSRLGACVGAIARAGAVATKTLWRLGGLPCGAVASLEQAQAQGLSEHGFKLFDQWSNHLTAGRFDKGVGTSGQSRARARARPVRRVVRQAEVITAAFTAAVITSVGMLRRRSPTVIC